MTPAGPDPLRLNPAGENDSDETAQAGRAVNAMTGSGSHMARFGPP